MSPLSPCLGCEIPKQADLDVLQMQAYFLCMGCSCCSLSLSLLFLISTPSAFSICDSTEVLPSLGSLPRPLCPVDLPPPPPVLQILLFTPTAHTHLPCAVLSGQGALLCRLSARGHQHSEGHRRPFISHCVVTYTRLNSCL